MLYQRSREDELLLCCSSRAADLNTIRKLVQADLRWHQILAKAVRWGVAPLVYSNLKKISTADASVPKEIMEPLRGWYLFNAVRNLVLYERLKDVLAAFSQAGIAVVVLKGAFLAEWVYEDVALRPMGDVDLLVKKEDLDSANQLLGQLGFSSNGSKEWHRKHHHHLAPFVASDRSLVLEVHHHIIAPDPSLWIPISDLWQRARTTQVASMSTLALCPEDLLLHLCLHISHSHGFAGQLRMLCDIAESAARYKVEIDWEKFLERVHAYRMAGFLYYPLWLARTMVKAIIPEKAMKELRKLAAKGFLADRSIKFILQRAVLIDEPVRFPIPDWLIRDVFAEWLSSKRKSEKVKTVSSQIWKGFVSSNPWKATYSKVPNFIYMTFIHPFYLIVKAVGLFMARRRS